MEIAREDVSMIHRINGAKTVKETGVIIREIGFSEYLRLIGLRERAMKEHIELD